MADAPWTLEESWAILRTEWLRGMVRPTAPQQGITGLDWDHVPQAGELLGVTFPESKLPCVDDIDDVYLRGSDLVVTYAEVPRRPYRCQIYWRIRSAAGRRNAPSTTTVLDVVVSAETSQLNRQLDLGVTFSLAAGAMVSPANGLDSPRDDVSARRSESETLPCCLVAIQGGGRPNVAMLVHPDDFRDVRVDPGASQRHPTRVTFPLFGTRIEKGVIMRARARCVLFVSETDRTTLLTWQADLLGEPLPLTT